MDQKDFKTGLYQHFKGGMCLVLGVAKHTETDEDMVVYVHSTDTHHFWVRPMAMFLEEIERDGKKMKRFTYVGGF